MPQNSDNYSYRHAVLLIKRAPWRSFWQMAPAFLASLILAKMHFLLAAQDAPVYIHAFLIVALLLLTLSTLVIYIRESRLELESFNYAFMAGLKMTGIIRIIYIKWLLINLTGSFAGLMTQLLMTSSFFKPENDLLPLWIQLIGLNLFFVVILGISTMIYAVKKWKL